MNKRTKYDLDEDTCRRIGVSFPCRVDAEEVDDQGVARWVYYATTGERLAGCVSIAGSVRVAETGPA